MIEHKTIWNTLSKYFGKASEITEHEPECLAKPSI
jgi:hypothetical protein